MADNDLVARAESLPRLATGVWIWAPLRVAPRSIGLRRALSDGFYLLGIPRFATALALASPVFGFFLGVTRLTHDDVFSQSVLVLSVAVVLAAFASYPGVLFCLGFAVGDFLGRSGQWGPSDFVDNRVPLLLSYLALGGFILLSVGVRTALTDVRFLVGLPPRTVRAVLMTLLVVGVMLAVYVWSQTSPSFVVAIFSWRGAPVPKSATRNFRDVRLLLVALAGAASLLRIGLALLLDRVPATSTRSVQGDAAIILREQEAAAFVGTNRIPRIPRCAMQAAVATMLLSGLFGSVFLGLIAFGAVFGLRLGQTTRAVPPLLRAPVRLAATAPAILRLFAVGVTLRWVSYFLVSLFGSSTLVIGALLGLGALLTYVLFPGQPDDGPVVPPTQPVEA